MGDISTNLRRIVFVIGAGADKVYGYPDGGELTTLICETLKNNTSPHYTSLQALIRDPKVLDEFRERFFYSETYSINAFLKRNPEFEYVGKQVIARFLMQCESDENLFSKKKETNAEHWYRKMFFTIDNHLNGDWKKLQTGQFCFINFNYSRSLKHYIYCKLKYLHKMTDPEITEVIQKLNILQIHGHLGNLPFEARHGRPYAFQTNIDFISHASEYVRLAYETAAKDPNAPLMAKIQDAIRLANKIFFFGFSYHPDNLELLKVAPPPVNGISMTPRPKLYSSGIGISKSELDRITKAIGNIKGLAEGLSIMQVLEAYEFI